MATTAKAEKTAKPKFKKIDSSKTSKSKIDKKELDSKNLKNTITKVVESKREVKYKYPEEIAGDQLKAKKWRAGIRSKNEKFLSEIADLEKTNKPVDKIKKEYAKFRKENYLVP